MALNPAPKNAGCLWRRLEQVIPSSCPQHRYLLVVRPKPTWLGVRLLDLRRSFADRAAALRSRASDWNGLNTRLQTTALYVHRDDGPVYSATQRISDLITDAL